MPDKLCQKKFHSTIITSVHILVIEIHIGLFRNWNVTFKSWPIHGGLYSFVPPPYVFSTSNRSPAALGSRPPQFAMKTNPPGGCHPNARPGLRLSLQLCSGSRILCNTKGYKKKRQLLFRVFYTINITADR